MTVRRALCIGIDDYPGGGSLNGAVADARAWAALLGERFGCREVALLTNRAASAAGIRRALEGLAADTAAGDSLVLVLAGHGSMAVAEGGGDGPVEPVFCPFDLMAHRVALREMLALGQALPARAHLSVVLDASFAVTITRAAVTEDEIAVSPGSDVRRRSLFPAAFRAPMTAERIPPDSALAPPPGTVLLAASAAHECAHEGFFPRGYRGALSWHAIEWLRTCPSTARWRDLAKTLATRVPSPVYAQRPRLIARPADLAKAVFFSKPA